MNRKYVFFDIDGTLTDRRTGKVVPSALDAINKLKANGHFAAIATGRAYYKAVGVMNNLGFDNMVCYGGGSLVVNHKLLYIQPLDHKKALTIIAEAEEKGIGYVLMLDDSIKVYSKDNLFVEQCGGRKEPTEYIVDPSLKPAEHEIYKIYLSLSKDEEDQFRNLDLLGNLRFIPEYLMYQYDAKDQGIIEMMKYLHGDLKDVIVFGDDDNDEVMFRKEWTSVAMGNATENLKKKATFITDRNVDNGIYNACVKLGLIDQGFLESVK